MMIPGSGSQVDGQWIDYYALLDVPISADEDSIRRRIGKVYADAASNTEHRNATRRDYYRSLLERVLPQCRRVLLDSEWRARYDHQHFLHREKDGAAQSYVAFIGSMRSDSSSEVNQALLPQRAQEELNAARQVVETALSGAELELLPSEAVSNMMAVAVEGDATAAAEIDFGAMPETALQIASATATPTETAPAPMMPRLSERSAQTRAAPLEIVAQVQPSDLAAAPAGTATLAGTAAPSVAKTVEPATVKTAVATEVETAIETRQGMGTEARATVITAQEAADIRRRRASNPNAEPFAGPSSREVNASRQQRSRVVVEVNDPALKKKHKLSPTSLNLMVAITGVLLTITIQRFASTPAIATSAGRTPIVLAVAPELQGAIESASVVWEKTPAGADYDVIVQSVDSALAMQRALGKSGDQIDGWIPANAGYAQRYNELAPDAKRPPLQIGDSLAQTPMVLVARADKADALRRAFPTHKIGTWAALRKAVMQDAKGRFGLSDPRQSLPGALARFSMAREWGEIKGKSAEVAANDTGFWQWMDGFEANVPSSAPLPDAMVKDMVLGTTGRYWWAVSYESNALDWIGQGKDLELFYLPRTALADHPFCAVERVGAPLEVASGRTAFVDYMKSEGAQKTLLQSGFRPTEISPSAKIEKNPFIAPATRARGVQLQGLPRDERFNATALGTIQKQWSKNYG